MDKLELGTLIEELISIKNRHRGTFLRSDVDTINRACNVLEEIAYGGETDE